MNRVDEIVIFKHLERDDIKKIIDIQLEGTRQQFEKLNKELVVRDEVIDFIIEKGYSKEYGARHISRTLKKHLLEKIAHCSLEREWENARQVVCSLHKGDVVLQLETEEIAPLDDSELIEHINIE